MYVVHNIYKNIYYIYYIHITVSVQYSFCFLPNRVHNKHDTYNAHCTY